MLGRSSSLQSSVNDISAYLAALNIHLKTFSAFVDIRDNHITAVNGTDSQHHASKNEKTTERVYVYEFLRFF